MTNIKKVIINGFAIFSMFFGSGNLVFPLYLGHIASAHWPTASFGLIISGVLLPFMGFFVVSKFDGSYHKFFSTAGRSAEIFLPFLCLSLLGSFAVVPRCITVSLGSFLSILPKFPPIIFSAILSLTILFLSTHKDRIIPLLGKVLTPILLLSLGTFIIVGIYNLESLPFTVKADYNNHFLYLGIVTGYQTMDLVAAFFFSSTVYLQLKKQYDSNHLTSQLIYAGIIGALCLGIVYLCFIVIAASLFEVNQAVPAYEILNASAIYLLGSKANFILCTAVILSCLTTAIALNSIYAEYLTIHLFNYKLSYFQTSILTNLIAFIISTYNFDIIAKILSPILEVSYPALIAITLNSLFNFKNSHFNKIIFYIILAISLVLNLMNEGNS